MHVFHRQGNYLLRRAASGEVEHHCKPMRNMNHRLSNVTYRKVPIFDEDTAKKGSRSALSGADRKSKEPLRCTVQVQIQL